MSRTAKCYRQSDGRTALKLICLHKKTPDSKSFGSGVRVMGMKNLNV